MPPGEQSKQIAELIGKAAVVITPRALKRTQDNDRSFDSYIPRMFLPYDEWLAESIRRTFIFTGL